jgi:hypothetical protein
MADRVSVLDVSPDSSPSFRGPPRLVWLCTKERLRESDSHLMKSDDVKTIFSIYEIWMSMEKERSAGDRNEWRKVANEPSVSKDPSLARGLCLSRRKTSPPSPAG